MAINAHDRYVVSGNLPGGEVFSFGWNTIFDSGSPVPSLQAQTDLIKTHLTGLATSAALRGILSTGSSYRSVKGYRYAPDATAASAQAESTLNVAGFGNQNHPDQVCIVATLRTAIAGRRYRGRIYLPGNGVTLDAQALISAPTVQQIADGVKALLLSNAGGYVPQVISRVAGTATPVTAVQVDSRPDIQRRRANKQGPVTVGTASLIA